MNCKIQGYACLLSGLYRDVLLILMLSFLNSYMQRGSGEMWGLWTIITLSLSDVGEWLLR